ISNIAPGTTSVGPEIAVLGHSLPNPHFKDDQANSFILANSSVKTKNENNDPLYEARKKRIPNNHYSNIAKRSYSFEINNGGGYFGTCWILDYQLTTNNTYPTKWYFGTNAHVLDDLRVKNDYNNYSKYNHNNTGRNTEYIKLLQLDNNSIGDYSDSSSGFYNWKSQKIDLKVSGDNINPVHTDNPKVKTVFMGLDYLDSKPSDFNTDKMWQGMEEVADFGVFEVEFDSPEIAKKITNDYVNWNEKEKFHLPTTSLLNSPDKGKKETQYILGFPTDVLNGQPITNISINQPLLPTPSENNLVTTGQRLSNSPWYQTLDDTRYGMFDGAIGLPWFNASFNDQWDDSITTNYKQWGLYYSIRHSNLLGGASGSMVIDQDYSTLAIQWGYDMSADFGFSQALISEGYDFNGKYGNYNLPKYDLINGGVAGQKNSYKQSLKKIYGTTPNYKTHLFPNGL
ncbi:MAG: DUF31 family protein, partial [Malacoplasma sp.]